jgi:hypothetical protein
LSEQRLSRSMRKGGRYAAVLIGAALLITAGYLWAWDAFARSAWERFERTAEPWVAIGTILLAAATFVLAHRARSEGNTALQEVEMSRRALQTSTQPLLVDAPLGVFLVDSPPGADVRPMRTGRTDRADVHLSAGTYSRNNEPFSGVSCRVPVQNAGPGLAFIERFSLHGLLADTPWRQSVSQTVVRPGELATFAFAAEIDRGDASTLEIELEGESDLIVELNVWYTDVAGEQRTRTRIVIASVPGGWRPTRTYLYHGDDEKPSPICTEKSLASRTL